MATQYLGQAAFFGGPLVQAQHRRVRVRGGQGEVAAAPRAGAGVDTWSGRSLPTVGLLHASFHATADLLEPGFDWVRYVVTVLLGLVAITALLSRREGRALPRQRPGAG